MTTRNVLFVLVSVIVIVIIPILPEVVYLIFKDKMSQKKGLALLSLALLFLGILSGILVYYLLWKSN